MDPDGDLLPDDLAKRLLSRVEELSALGSLLADSVVVRVTDASGRPEVVGDAVGAAEAGGGDDLFVVDALVAVARLVPVGGVPLARERPHLAVRRHDALRRRGISHR